MTKSFESGYSLHTTLGVRHVSAHPGNLLGTKKKPNTTGSKNTHRDGPLRASHRLTFSPFHGAYIVADFQAAPLQYCIVIARKCVAQSQKHPEVLNRASSISIHWFFFIGTHTTHQRCREAPRRAGRTLPRPLGKASQSQAATWLCSPVVAFVEADHQTTAREHRGKETSNRSYFHVAEV